MSSYRHALITCDLFASTCALDEFMLRKLLEQKSHRAETDFICDSVLKLDILRFETNKLWHILRSLLEKCVVLRFGVILVCNTFFDKHAEPWISNFQFKLDLLCSKSKKFLHVLNLFVRNYAITCLETFMVINFYFNVRFERLKQVIHVLRKETLISDSKKYMSCTYDPWYSSFCFEYPG